MCARSLIQCNTKSNDVRRKHGDKGREEEWTQLPADYGGFNSPSSVEKFGLRLTYCSIQQMSGTRKV